MCHFSVGTMTSRQCSFPGMQSTLTIPVRPAQASMRSARQLQLPPYNLAQIRAHRVMPCLSHRFARVKAAAAALQEQLSASQRALREASDSRRADRERSDLLEAYAARMRAACAALVSPLLRLNVIL